MNLKYSMDKVDFVKKAIVEVLIHLGVEALVEVSFDKDTNIVFVNIDGEDLGNLIGYHGENIVALRNIILTSLLTKFEGPVSLSIDVANYRNRREEKLKDIAKKVAETVLRTKKSQKLSPMTSIDRRVIHAEISTNFPELVSYSVGEGRDRRIIISQSEL